jgi:hypothetical protein
MRPPTEQEREQIKQDNARPPFIPQWAESEDAFRPLTMPDPIDAWQWTMLHREGVYQGEPVRCVSVQYGWRFGFIPVADGESIVRLFKLSEDEMKAEVKFVD